MRTYLTLLAGLSLACGPRSAPSAPAPVSDAGIPGKLHGYRMTATEPIAESDGGGTLYRFRDDTEAYITVFLYPIPQDVTRAGVATQWVVIEGEKFAQVMPIQVQRGRYDSYEMAFANREPVTAGRDTIPGFVAAAVTRSQKQLSVQLQYLYLIRGQFLKIRATLPERGWQDAPIALFAQDLARLVFSHPR